MTIGRCTNEVEDSIPTAYHYRQVKTRCGNTNYYGERTICDKCRRNASKMESWRIQEANNKADNQWLKSAGWGEM